MARSTGTIRGEQIRDESVASVDIASGSIKGGELHEEAVSGHPVLGSADATNDRLLIWDANDGPTGSLKQIAPANLGVGSGGGSSPAGADTQLQFNDGGSFGASANLTWDDTELKISGTGTSALLNLHTTEDSSTAGPVLELTRVSSSPADADYLGQIKFVGKHDGNGVATYAKITGKIDDASVNSEDGIIEFANVKGGNQTVTARLRSDSLQLLNSTNLSVDGTAEFSGFLYHKDDDDTYIKFDDDDINIQAGGVNFIDITQGGTNEITFNEAGADVDFRVEGDNNTHLLYVDGGNDKVGIGTVPQTTLHVHADSIHDGAVTISQADNSEDASQLDLAKARGSGASPADVQNGDFVGQVRFLGYEGSSYQNFADIYAQAAGTIDAANHPTKIVIRTTPLGGTSPVSAVTIDEGQNITAAGGVYGKMRHMTHHRYSDTSGSGKEYIPFAGTVNEQNSPSSQTQGIAPYNGRLVTAYVRSSRSGGLGSTVVGLHIGVDGQQVVSTTAEETVTVAMNQQNTTYAFNFTAANHFAATDIIGLSIDPTNIHGNVNVTCIWEYDITV